MFFSITVLQWPTKAIHKYIFYYCNLYLNAKRQVFLQPAQQCRDTATCRSCSVQMKSSVFNFLYSQFFVAIPRIMFTADLGVNIGLWKVSFSICPLLHPTRARFPLFEFVLIGFVVKKLKCQFIKGKARVSGKIRVGKNEKSNWESSSRCFSSFSVLIGFNILSSFFHFSWVDHVVYEGHNYHSQQCVF